MAHSRRTFLETAGLIGTALAASDLTLPRFALAQSGAPGTRLTQTPVLTIGYEQNGDPSGFPIVLLHGFPDDVRAWDGVVPPLVKAGYRVLVPYLRGYGSTRFRDANAPRMAEQAAIGQDVVDFMDTLGLERVALAGYDWGGRAAAIAAALHPDRVRATLLIGGYTIQNTLVPPQPASPAAEKERWYQWYFNTDAGRAGLAANRRSICRFLWETWSPGWQVTDDMFNRTAPSFDNPDFVDVVIHSYRHRVGNAPGEPRFKAMEEALATRPPVQAPSIVLYGANDPLGRAPAEASPAERVLFPSLVAHRVIAGAGHFLPREKPDAVSGALLELLAGAR